jgi:sulfite exporter TauE/SafE
MTFSFALAAFLMGLAGGPHCVAMCGGACAIIKRTKKNNTQYLLFHLGRILGYATLGAIAAASVKSLAWFSSQTSSLHPLWTFFHTLLFAWGLVLLIFAKQPTWADNLGRKIWNNLELFTTTSKSTLVTGFLWTLMPCGLLYSALLVASLQANPLNGAVSMAAFALGTSLTLFFAPLLWLKLKDGVKWLTEDMSMRLAGMLLCFVSGVAIWMDVVHQTKIWCN